MSASSSKQLVFSTMRSDFLRMFFQWLLAGDQFAPDSSVTEPHAVVRATCTNITDVPFQQLCCGVYRRR